MSVLNVNRVVDASGGVLAPISSVMRNRIINGAMVIDQRNAGASVTPTDAQFITDRWMARLSQASKFSAQRNAGAVTPPVGFTNYLGATSLSSYALSAGDYFAFQHRIEGFNVSDLSWGTANAQPITFSFWVRSSLTGTFGGSILNNAANRSYPFTYAISAANTWEQKSVTIAGDTTGTWLTNNNIGLDIWLGLGVGSTFSGTAGSWSGSSFFSAIGATSVVGTNGATFYVTGVQLERGTQTTSFEHRQYQQELALCQRYAIVYGGDSIYERFAIGEAVTTTEVSATLFTPVQMRITPALSTNTASNFAIYSRGAITTCSSILINFSSPLIVTINGNVASGLTAGSGAAIIANNNTNARLTLNSEI